MLHQFGSTGETTLDPPMYSSSVSPTRDPQFLFPFANGSMMRFPILIPNLSSKILLYLENVIGTRK